MPWRTDPSLRELRMYPLRAEIEDAPFFIESILYDVFGEGLKLAERSRLIGAHLKEQFEDSGVVTAQSFWRYIQEMYSVYGLEISLTRDNEVAQDFGKALAAHPDLAGKFQLRESSGTAPREPSYDSEVIYFPLNDEEWQDLSERRLGELVKRYSHAWDILTD